MARILAYILGHCVLSLNIKIRIDLLNSKSVLDRQEGQLQYLKCYCLNQRWLQDIQNK